MTIKYDSLYEHVGLNAPPIVGTRTHGTCLDRHASWYSFWPV